MNLKKYVSLDGHLFIIFLAIVLLFQNSWVSGFFQDGYLYAAFAKHAASFGDWLIPSLSKTTYSYFPVHSPFVFSLNGLAFKLFGPSYTVARIFSGMFTLICLISLLNFVDRFGDKKWSFLSGLIFILVLPLIKKSRFPSLDPPLMLFIFLSLTNYYKGITEDSRRSWILSGIFFGLALLTKGPMSGLIIIGIISHLIFIRKISALKQLSPWLGISIGFSLFLIWPLTLYLNGRWDVFEIYLDFTFRQTMVDGRGISTFNYFDYIIFLVKQVNIWFLFLVYSTFYSIKKEKDYLNSFSLIVFYTLLVFLSIPKLKYSNYLLPLYPFMAIAAGYGLKQSIKKFSFEKIKLGVMYLALTCSLILLVFPLTNTSRRDKILFETLKVTKGLNKIPTTWVSVNESYPFFALANLIGFEIDGEAVKLAYEDFKGHLLTDNQLSFKSEEPVDWKKESFLFIVNGVDFRKLKEEIKNKLIPILYFKSKDLYILVEKEMVPSDSMLSY